jgi:hypothetical protein
LVCNFYNIKEEHLLGIEEINILFKPEEITATWLLRTLNLAQQVIGEKIKRDHFISFTSS